MIKKLSRAFALVVVPFLGSLLMRLIYLTNKKIIHNSQGLPEKPFILACWHGELLMLSHFYTNYRKPNVKAMISNHFDGELIARTIAKFGIESMAGSTTRNAAKVLIQAIRTIKNGQDVALTPDGPRGPRHEVAAGVIAIAQKTDAPIVLVRMKPTSYWQLNSWDKFIIPKPFGTIHYYPHYIDSIKGVELEEAKKMIKRGLLVDEK